MSALDNASPDVATTPPPPDTTTTTTNNESTPTSKNKETVKIRKDDDKNIHVPKDNKLKIEYVSVRNAFLHAETVFYEIDVKTSQHYWHVTKRYSQFEDLHHQLSQLSKDKLPLIPAKHYKWFTDHTKSSFIEKRRALLDNYVKKLIQTANVNSSQCVVNFFHNDKSAQSVIEKEEIINTIQDNEEHKGDNSDKAHRLSDEWDFPKDQEITNIIIQSTRKMTDHVLYQICVSNSHKRASFRAWTVLKRFTQFYDMDLQLRATIEIESPHLIDKLPPAPTRKFKFVHDHMDDDFIEERRVLLQNYLSKLLRFPEVAKNEDFLGFLGVDINN
eukprot:158288_1